ncbi:hypothetical protein B296_00006480 [Ensete ventricosum]|uniref:Uncharacterized protein n=1 Tax=Ensete ventricosum TaxID=4639 RepID=A0A427ABZ5_ENSVE|nr:hypothetical protein B296_00006480 [Ensete ventricosum]
MSEDKAEVTVCLSNDQGELLEGHNSVEAGGQKGEEATTSPVGLNYLKAKRRLERRWTRRSTIVPQR